MKHSVSQPVKPEFSLIMANYNGEKYIEEAINSVLNQSFQEWELIIIEDCSTDGSLKIIEKYLDDQRIRLIRHKKNRGYTAALKTGVSHVKAEIFGILDSDDVLFETALSTMYDAHQQYLDCGMIYSQFLFCDEALNLVQIGYCRQIPPDKTNVECDAVSHFKTFKLSHYNLTEGFTEDIIYAQDKDISYKMEEVSKLQYVDKVLYRYRMIPTSVSRNSNYKGIDYVVKAKLNALKRRDDKNKREQKEALEHFVNGIGYFYREDFSKAESEMINYRKLIDYELFPRIDSRPILKPDLSVVIVAYNTNQLLLDCLNSLFYQSHINFEIIVVDNGGNDEVLKQLLALPILYVKCPMNFILSEGRNIGAHFAKADIFSSLDDDATVPNNYIESILKAFNKYEIYALRGKVIPMNPHNFRDKIGLYDIGDTPIPSSIDAEGNSAYAKKIYQEMQGMNPLLFGGEGLDLSIRISNSYGENMTMYWPETIIFHDPADSKKNQEERYRLMHKYLAYKYPFVWTYHANLFNYSTSNMLQQKGHSLLKVRNSQRFSQESHTSNIPKISVIMSVYNGGKYLKAAIESILNQTYQDFEFVILDDASTDNTEEILNNFNDKRIKIIKNSENLGLTKSLNKGLKLARGEYIARMDADDISHPLRFEKQFDFLETHKECLVLGTFMSIINENGEKYGVWGQYTNFGDIKNGLLIQNEIGHGSTMSRRLALEKVGYYNEKFLYAQDYDLWLRLSEIGELRNLPEELYSLRYCRGCISIDKKDIQAKYASMAREDALIRQSNVYAGKNNKKKLSIVHINTHDIAGGAAKVAWRLAEAQRNAGHNSRMLVGYKKSDSEYSSSFSVEVDRLLHAQCLREGQLFYEFQESHQLINNSLIRTADILNIHNLHGWYFNPFSISALSHLKPIVWTLHDMQSFTGHCAHSFNCEKWQTGCGECPYLNVEAALTVDTSAQLWKDKKLIYDHSYLWIVTPSDWLKKKVERSILKNQHVSLIYNGIDTCIFHPYSKREIKRALALPDNAIIIGTAAHGGISNQWKGGHETQQALDTLLRKYQNLVFLNIGGMLPNTDNRFINTGHIEDESIIAQFYSCLDIFIYTSIADNCPLTILEALACGVPIVTFDTGGIPELVHDGSEGFVIKNRNIDDLILATDNLIDNHTSRDTFSKNARERAVSTFDHNIIAGHYENLYEQYLEERRTTPRETRLFPVSSLPKIIMTPNFISAENKKINIRELHPEKPSETENFQTQAGAEEHQPDGKIIDEDMKRKVMDYINQADVYLANNDLPSARQVIKHALRNASGHSQLSGMLLNILVTLESSENSTEIPQDRSKR